eukprot:445738_1
MFMFITPHDLNKTADLSHAKIFEPGVYQLEQGYPKGTGAFAVNDSNACANKDVTAVILKRGAFVMGRIYINKENVNMYGPGIISSQVFNGNHSVSHDSKYWNEAAHPINTNGLKNSNVYGITSVIPNNPHWGQGNQGIASLYKYVQFLSFDGNQGGGEMNINGRLEDSFMKMNDDIIKMHQSPPSTTLRLVIWEGHNGGVFQLGQGGTKYNDKQPGFNCSDIYIIQTMYYKTCGNCAVFNCAGSGGNEWDYLYYKNIYIDGNIANFLLWYFGDNNHVKNAVFDNVHVQGKITVITKMSTNSGSTIQG